MEHGIIKGFRGSYMSGIGHLIIENVKTGMTEAIPCDNGATVRALEWAFGDVIGNAHDVEADGGHVNQEIYWDWDDFWLTLGGFTPVEEMV